MGQGGPRGKHQGAVIGQAGIFLPRRVDRADLGLMIAVDWQAKAAPTEIFALCRAGVGDQRPGQGRAE